MAKTLQELKKEFEAIKKEMPTLADKIQSNDNNLNQHRDMLNDNFEQLGPRIHELRDGGVQGTKIEAFMHDREIAVMIKELSNRRETAKATAKINQALVAKDLAALKKRISTLQETLAAEIKTRKGKASSAKLGLNQSWKEMEPLEAEVKKWVNSNADYEWAKNYNGTFGPDQFDRLYTLMLTKEMNKSKAVVLNTFQQMMQTQMLNVKNLQRKFTEARSLYNEIDAAAKTGKQAHASRNIQTLSSAKRDASTALDKLKEIVDPYNQAMNDAKIKDLVDHSADKGKIQQGVSGMLTMLQKAQEMEGELRARTFA
jgi:hypothetical protein